MGFPASRQRATANSSARDVTSATTFSSTSFLSKLAMAATAGKALSAAPIALSLLLGPSSLG